MKGTESPPDFRHEPQKDGRVIVRLHNLRPIICDPDRVPEAEKKLADAWAKTMFFLGSVA